ncbi:metallophosphoesterase [Martelella soudanensis]|uniref:metallophosphoesterase n=1 Tax=unclassified Martelella TaxID=2629616 RepID=UPI0015DEDD92|nr:MULTISPECIES: metallophosphoesterase [unclassified Martelella]
MKSLRRLFTRPKPEGRTEAPPQFRGGLPSPDEGFVAIGDVHGCAEALAALWDKLAKAAPGMTIIHVGDYIDRGEDSAGVLRMLHERQAHDGDIVCLKGNHEEMFLDFLREPEEKGERWLRYGGLQTLQSFGDLSLGKALPERDFVRIRDGLIQQLGEAMIGFLATMPRYWRSGNVAVVHAGADPREPLDRQRPASLTWGHPAFGELPRSDGLWIVHGHTVVDMPIMANGVISIDTGAYAKGRLTAAIIRPGREVEFLQAASQRQG